MITRSIFVFSLALVLASSSARAELPLSWEIGDVSTFFAKADKVKRKTIRPTKSVDGKSLASTYCLYVAHRNENYIYYVETTAAAIVIQGACPMRGAGYNELRRRIRDLQPQVVETLAISWLYRGVGQRDTKVCSNTYTCAFSERHYVYNLKPEIECAKALMKDGATTQSISDGYACSF